jgi:hypothetical protein
VRSDVEALVPQSTVYDTRTRQANQIPQGVPRPLYMRPIVSSFLRQVISVVQMQCPRIHSSPKGVGIMGSVLRYRPKSPNFLRLK